MMKLSLPLWSLPEIIHKVQPDITSNCSHFAVVKSHVGGILLLKNLVPVLNTLHDGFKADVICRNNVLPSWCVYLI